MKLRIREFERLAKGNGYGNGRWLMRRLGAGKNAYAAIKNGNQIGYDLAKELYNTFGVLAFLEVIDLEGETLGGFRSKYVAVEGKLY